MILSTSRKLSIVREYPKEIFDRSFFSQYRVGEKARCGDLSTRHFVGGVEPVHTNGISNQAEKN